MEVNGEETTATSPTLQIKKQLVSCRVVDTWQMNGFSTLAQKTMQVLQLPRWKFAPIGSKSSTMNPVIGWKSGSFPIFISVASIFMFTLFMYSEDLRSISNFSFPKLKAQELVPSELPKPASKKPRAPIQQCHQKPDKAAQEEQASKSPRPPIQQHQQPSDRPAQEEEEEADTSSDSRLLRGSSVTTGADPRRSATWKMIHKLGCNFK